MYRPNHNNPRRHRRRMYFREHLVWPLPDIRGHGPSIVALDRVTFEATLAYRDSPLDGPLATPVMDLRANANARPFYMPENCPVLAVQSGVVMSTRMEDGISIDHRNGFYTNYRGVFEALVEARREVNAGDVIGTIRSPASAPRALRFELRRYQWQAELLPGHPRISLSVNPLSALLHTISVPIERLRRPLRTEAASKATRKEAA